MGSNPVYISLDIDVVDPGHAPATGTPGLFAYPSEFRWPLTYRVCYSESGGWSSREVKRILRGFSGMNIVGVDIVEVSPPYDTNAEVSFIFRLLCHHLHTRAVTHLE